jgi:hypothetical protein
MDSGYLGSATHAALALAGLVEARAAKSRSRSLLTGCLIGWHIFAAIYDFRKRLTRDSVL